MTWCGVALLALGITPAAASAQHGVEPAVPLARVLVLGTYHFANPGRDIVKSEVADVLAAEKQAEVAEVLEALARFRPTRVAVEARPEAASRLDSLYLAYREGRHAPSRSEVEQLGFRLAARFDHAHLHPADHDGDFPFDAVMEYAKAHDPAFLAYVARVMGEITAEMNRLHREETIGGVLRAMNDPEVLRQDHAHYLEFARVGANESHVGADLLAKWYERNIRIFANLQRIAEPGERVLVIFGAGHAAILRELIASDARLQLVDAMEYLPHAP